MAISVNQVVEKAASAESLMELSAPAGAIHRRPLTPYEESPNTVVRAPAMRTSHWSPPGYP